MADSRPKSIKGKMDSPYQRMGVLLAGIVVAVGLIFGVNMFVQALGGNDKKLAEALLTTLQQERINGEFSLATQAQSNTFDAKGSFSVADMTRAEVDAEVNGQFGEETLRIPLKLRADFAKGVTYVRVANAQKVADSIASAAPSIESDLDSIAKKIDNNWLKMGEDTSASNTCTSRLFEKVAADENAAKEMAGVYAGNRFLNVSNVETKDSGREEYTVEIDDTAMSDFVTSIKQTDFFADTEGCDETFDLLGAEANAEASAAQAQAGTQDEGVTTDTKVIVDDGKIVEFVTVSSLNNQVNTTRVSFDFEEGASIDMPTKDIVSYDAIQTELSSLGELFQEQQSSMLNAQGTGLPQ